MMSAKRSLLQVHFFSQPSLFECIIVLLNAPSCQKKYYGLRDEISTVLHGKAPVSLMNAGVPHNTRIDCS